MHNAIDSTLTVAISRLADHTKALLQESGFEDCKAIIWATFSDDDGATRIVYRSRRANAANCFSVLSADDLLEGLQSARERGLTKLFWGLPNSSTD